MTKNNYDPEPAQIEHNFLAQTDSRALMIMGIQFSSTQYFHITVDSIANNIYAGYHPDLNDVRLVYEQLEQHVPTNELIDKLKTQFCEPRE